MAVLDRLKLETPTAAELAAIGHGVLDRRELQKVVLAFAWTFKHQEHEPNGQQRVPPNSRLAPYGEGPANNLSLIGRPRNGLR